MFYKIKIWVKKVLGIKPKERRINLRNFIFTVDENKSLTPVNNLYITYVYNYFENVYYAECEELELFCTGITFRDLLDSIEEDIVTSWYLYVESQVSELSNDAIELRNTLLSTFLCEEIQIINVPKEEKILFLHTK